MTNSPDQLQNNGEALAGLFQLSEFDLSGANGSYPESLVLPSVVHEGIQKAVAKADDGYERSLNFYYKDEDWGAGRIASGGQGHASLLHGAVTHIRKLNPTMFVHTHPPAVDHYAPGVPFGRTLSRLMRSMKDEKVVAHEEARAALPSAQDTVSSFSRPYYSSLGEMVASRKGIYLFLRNPDEITRIPPDYKQMPKEERRARARQEWGRKDAIRKSIGHAEREVKKLEDIDALHPALAAVIAMVVRSRITCYASTDIDSGEIKRVLEV